MDGGQGDNGGEGVAAFRHRHDGWTPARQVAFLRALRESGCVKAACGHVGLSTTSAYRVKARIPAFGDAWDQALAFVAPVLERAAMARAVEGWLEPIVYKGEVVGHRRRYSDALLRMLLLREDERKVTPPPARRKDERREAAEALLKQLRAQARRGGTPEPAWDDGGPGMGHPRLRVDDR